MHCVYVLQSKKDKKLYTGYSKNSVKRLVEHNSGKVASTQNRTPFKLIYCEFFVNKEDALNREEFLKTGWGRNQLNKILKHTLNTQNFWRVLYFLNSPNSLR